MEQLSALAETIGAWGFLIAIIVGIVVFVGGACLDDLRYLKRRQQDPTYFEHHRSSRGVVFLGLGMACCMVLALAWVGVLVAADRYAESHDPVRIRMSQAASPIHIERASACAKEKLRNREIVTITVGALLSAESECRREAGELEQRIAAQPQIVRDQQSALAASQVRR